MRASSVSIHFSIVHPAAGHTLAAGFIHGVTLAGALLRWKLALAVSATMLAGFLVAGGHDGIRLILTVAGGFFGCSGCSALNQIQERQRDECMVRTATRPLVTGELSPAAAGIAAALLFCASGIFLYQAGHHLSMYLLILITVLYNGMYTPLKSRTPWAILPGALSGALPPILGSVCGGSSLFLPQGWLLCLLLFLWQFPHAASHADMPISSEEQFHLP